MTQVTYLEETKKDIDEMAQILKEIPESKKESILMLVKGFALGVESENQKTAAG